MALFTRIRGAGGTTFGREIRAIATLAAAEDGVLRPLAQLDHAEQQRAEAGWAQAASAASEALMTGVVAGIIAILAITGFSLLAVRLLRRPSGREQELTAAAGRLETLVDELEGTLRESDEKRTS